MKNAMLAISRFWTLTQSLFDSRSDAKEWDHAESVLHTLARTIEAKDQYTLGHADRVSQFAVELGRSMGVAGFELDIRVHRAPVGYESTPQAFLMARRRTS